MEMVDPTVVGTRGSTITTILGVVGGGRRVEEAEEEEGGCSQAQLVALPVEEQEQGTWVSWDDACVHVVRRGGMPWCEVHGIWAEF